MLEQLLESNVNYKPVDEARRWSQKIKFGSKLPAFSGLYAVYYADKLVYIGKSTNLNTRVQNREFLYIQNVYPEIQVYIRYLPLREKELKLINGSWLSVEILMQTELRYIKILNPPLNRTNLKNNSNFLNPKPRMPFYKRNK